MTIEFKNLVEEISEELQATGADPSYRTLVEAFPLVKIMSRKEHASAIHIKDRLTLYLRQSRRDETQDGVSETQNRPGIQAYLQTLTVLIADFEKTKLSKSFATTGEVLGYLMKQNGLKQTDLAEELGGQSIVSKVLKGERMLNLRQIKALAKRFRIAPEIFM